MNRLNAFAHVFVPYVAEDYQTKCVMNVDMDGATRVNETIIRRQAFYYGAGFALFAYEVAPYLGEWTPLCCIFSGFCALVALGAGNQMYEEFKEIRNAQIIIVREVQGNAS
jgi:hypothetical protein